MILGVMNPGIAFLAVVGILVLFAVGLLASGVVKVDIEVRDENDEELGLEEIKALDDSTLLNRIMKRLAKFYEKLLEKKKLKEGKNGKENGS